MLDRKSIFSILLESISTFPNNIRSTIVSTRNCYYSRAFTGIF